MSKKRLRAPLPENRESTIVSLWLFANALALMLAVAAALNAFEFPVIRARASDEPVDIIVAMRDEESNAAAFLDAALAVRNVARVIVVDDGSSDRTFEIAEGFAARDPRVRLLRSNGSGKTAALALGAQHASAAWLLFLDADVRANTAPGSLIAFAREREADAVTAWPRVRVISFGGMLLAPIVTYFLLQFLPQRVARSANVAAAAGNGQCFLVSREAYDRCGGHAAIRAVVEDVALARALKRAGARVELGSAADIATVRSYDSFAQGLRGNARSLYFGSGRVGCTIVAVWLLLMLISPFPLYAARIAIAQRMREPWYSLLLAPLGAVAGIAAAIYGLIAGAKGTLRWRGRVLRGGEPS